MTTTIKEASTWGAPAGRLLLPVNAPRDEWLQARRTGVGGSDIATIMGHNRYSHIYELWLDKTSNDKAVDEQSEAMWWGSHTERLTAQRFEQVTGLVTKRAGTYRHRDCAHHMVNPDRFSADGGVVEIKDHELLSDAGSLAVKGTIPDAAFDQIQWNLHVTGRQTGWFAAKVGKQTVVLSAPRDDDFIDRLVEAADDFWRHVTEGTPPPVDPVSATDAELVARWPTTTVGEATDATDQAMVVEMQLESLAQAAAEVKRWKQVEAAAKTQLKAIAAGREFVTVDGRPVVRIAANGTFSPTRFTKDHPGLATEYETTKTVLDTKRLAADHPDLYAQYRAQVIRPITNKEETS